MNKKYLTPIKVKEPPCHTQIHPRCYTCKKFPVCNIREDYLKTAYLIQQVLGDPQEDRELCQYNHRHDQLLDFRGFKFDNSEEYLPNSIQVKEKIEPKESSTLQVAKEGEEEGEKKGDGILMEARYRDKDIVQFLYNINGYFVLFEAIFNGISYEISCGREIYYGLHFDLSTDSISEIQVGLEEWRKLFERKENCKETDVINTTYFSAQLNCDFYEWEKGLTEEEGIKRIIAQFPDGVPCRGGKLYHLATFHIEPHKVPCYHPENGNFAFAPMPYPIFVPKPCHKKPPKPPMRRGDIDCDC